MMEAPRPNPNPAEMKDETLVAIGRGAFLQEAGALETIGRGLDADFARAVRCLYDCEGRVLVTGLGKSGIVARKLAASLTSTGTPSHFIHPVEATHGDLGIVRGADILIAISRSGNNSEVVTLLARCEQFGMTTIAITGNRDSDIATRQRHPPAHAHRTGGLPPEPHPDHQRRGRHGHGGCPGRGA